MRNIGEDDPQLLGGWIYTPIPQDLRSFMHKPYFSNFAVARFLSIVQPPKRIGTAGVQLKCYM